MFSVKTELKVLTQEECEILIWGKPRRKSKRKFLWELSDEPQGKVKPFGFNSTAYRPNDMVNL